MSEQVNELLQKAAALRALADDLRDGLNRVKSNPLDINLMIYQLTMLTEYVYGLMYSRADDLEAEITQKDDNK